MGIYVFAIKRKQGMWMVEICTYNENKIIICLHISSNCILTFKRVSYVYSTNS